MERYVKVRWFHEEDGDPVLYLSELADDRYETRKVQVYRNGVCEWADEANEGAHVGLSQVPFPPLTQIDGDPEFSAVRISAEEFEDAWRVALGGGVYSSGWGPGSRGERQRGGRHRGCRPPKGRGERAPCGQTMRCRQLCG